MQNLLANLDTKDMIVKSCEITTSVWIENLGRGKFKKHILPIEAQFAPINAIVAEDIDNDGFIDLLIGGNEYGTEFSTGRYDASYGLFLKGNGKGLFTPMQPAVTGFILDGDVRSIKLINNKSKKNILVGFNNDKAKYFQFSN